MSIQNGERLVTKQDLADFYNDIRPYMGGLPEIVANKFSRGDLYSTEEKMIGQWVDGKPLYQRVFTISSDMVLTAGSYYDTNIEILNVGALVSTYAVALETGNSKLDLTGYIDTESNNLQIKSPFAYTLVANKHDIVIQYTKTTDVVTPIGSDTDYSTEERKIGITWLDGKSVWQKTIYVELSSASVSQAHNIASLETVISIDVITIPVSGGNQRRPIPNLYSNDSNWSAGIYVDNTEVIIDTGSSFRSRQKGAYVTIKYTKTIDFSSSDSETDYSTTEKIVGSWINGKPVWQKTIYVELSSADVLQAHNIASLETVVSVDAITIPVSGGNQRRPVPYVHESNSSWSADIYVNNVSIGIESGQSFRNNEKGAYVTLQYTKTTT